MNRQARSVAIAVPTVATDVWGLPAATQTAPAPAQTSPSASAHAIRPWAIWANEQRFDRPSFARAFVKHTRENVQKSGRPWTAEFENVVLAAATNRRQEITRVLQDADASATRR